MKKFFILLFVLVALSLAVLGDAKKIRKKAGVKAMGKKSLQVSEEASLSESLGIVNMIQKKSKKGKNAVHGPQEVRENKMKLVKVLN